MTPTPPGTDAASSASPNHEDRMRRNVACVNCRNSKVRCRSSTIAGQPCQRCDKLQLSCVVDKFHKRVTRRSKLEQLEQELKTIKQAVNPSANTESTWTPPSPRAPYTTLPDPNISGRVLGAGFPQIPTPLPEPSSVGTGSQLAQTVKRPPKSGPLQPRTLGDHVVTGEDIDWYFNKFFECFHPFLPILRKTDPDECYEACPTLFWIILYITCRRYTKDRIFFGMLAEHVGKDIWMMLSTPLLNLEAIHALLFLATWPLPNIRLVTDPTSTLVSVAMTNAMMMGLHTGRGSHKEFCIGTRKDCHSTDEEASATWLACCTLAQKVAACSGHPPPSIRLDDGHCKSSLDSPFWSEFTSMFDIQKYMNRFHTAVAAQITSTGGTSHVVISMWESELENVKPLLARSPTDFTTFLLLAAQLQMQIFYFNKDTAHANYTTSRINMAKAFHTARALIATVLEQEARSKFLTHAPHWAFRIVVDAACIAVSTLHSTASPDMAPNDAHVLAQQAFAAVHRCSVQENDLPHRAGVIIETFWLYRTLLPKLELGECTWSSRLSVGFTYWCLDKFKVGLQAAQRSSDTTTANKMQEALQPHSRTPVPTSVPQPVPADQPLVTQAQPITSATDPMQEIDWNMFMDDFGWVNEDGVLLGLP